jgi:lambda family phage portal protein
MAKLNAFDRMVGYFNPVSALRRQAARHTLEEVNKVQQRRYEGASKSSRTSSWFSPSSSPNAAIEPALETLRNRSRDLVRNNPYAESAVRAIVADTVGVGILPSIRSLAEETKTAGNIRSLFIDWAENPDSDFAGDSIFYAGQALTLRETVEAGEGLIRFVFQPSSSKLSVPLKIQYIEPDFIDTSKFGSTNSGGAIYQGVEYDRNGRKVAYWLFDKHPGETKPVLRSSSYRSERVPIDDLVPLKRLDRAGQVRGVPWGASAIIRLKDFDEYEDAQLVRQKIAACFSVIMRDGDFSESDTNKDAKLPIEEVEPGMVWKLPWGKDITTTNPPTVEGYREYWSCSLHGISRAYGGVPYERMTGDLSQYTYSAIKAGRNDFYSNIDQWRWHMIVPHFCRKVFTKFLQAAELRGHRTDGIVARWTAPRREYIDPVNEVNAKRSEVRSGLISLPEAVRERGFDVEEHFKEIAASNDLLDKMKIVLDSDPRKVSQVGFAQALETVQAFSGEKVGGADPGSENPKEKK